MGNIEVVAEFAGDSFSLPKTGENTYERNVASPLSTSNIEVVAEDEAGNITTDTSQTIRVIGEWTPPKIDWSGFLDGSTYVGDYFTYVDYNRIKNNILFLIGYASQMYNVTTFDLGEEKSEGEIPYADEFNMFEKAIESVNSETYGFNFVLKTWYENRNVPTFEDYNRIEKIQLKLYETLVAQKKAQNRLAFTLGGQKGLKV